MGSWGYNPIIAPFKTGRGPVCGGQFFFPDFLVTKCNKLLVRLMDEILHQHLEIELGQISASPLPPSSMLGVFCH